MVLSFALKVVVNLFVVPNSFMVPNELVLVTDSTVAGSSEPFRQHSRDIRINAVVLVGGTRFMLEISPCHAGAQ